MATNELILYGTVGASFWDEEYFTSAWVREQLSGMTGDLDVRINSGGGLAHEGQAIYTQLRDYAANKGAVTVIVDAVAMSAASLIAMAGDRRVIRDGAYMLIHDPASPFTDGRGTEADHLRLAQQLRVISNAYAEVYATRAGVTKDDARQIMRDETVLDGEAAVLMGFATEVEQEPAKVAATFDYRIYAHAPEGLRERSRSLGEPQGKSAALAMMAGISRSHTPTEALMADDKKVTESNSADDTKPRTPAREAPQEQPREPEKAPNGAPLPDRTVDPYGEPERPQEVEAAVRRALANARRIRDFATMSGVSMTVAEKLIEDRVPLETALDRINAAWKEAGDKDIAMPGRPTMRVTGDAKDRFVMGATKALLMKVGEKGGERNEFSSMTLSEMARVSLEMRGIRKPFSSKLEMVGAALTMAGDAPGFHTTGDFANVLGDVARKSVLRGWEEQPEQFAMITGEAVPLNDFRTSTAVDLGVFDNLAEKPEGAEYKYGTFGDRKISMALLTYGRLFAITREAIINDDLAILGRVPRKMGRAARRTVGNLVWAVLTGNPTLDDGIALFHASHGNLAGTPAALSVASLSAAISAMSVQRGDGVVVGIRPRYLVVPAALEFIAREIVNSAVYPATNRGMQANPVANAVEIIVEPRLDLNSTTAWYLVADPALNDVVMLGYLDGNEEPFLDERDTWSADGHEWKVRIDAGVAPGDYRAVYKNAGA